ncbi:hypothetical protein ACFQER_02385 [Halomicroarcula sp. GCM10025894]|uniref:hypothetical protein n=1 Tax=Halomicroarcula sp. GCM10025894 TaxID=3252673 RepID=UPI003619916E
MSLPGHERELDTGEAAGRCADHETADGVVRENGQRFLAVADGSYGHRYGSERIGNRRREPDGEDLRTRPTCIGHCSG